MKRIPYGISNFQELRENNYLYIDKTKYIEILEEYARYQFFIRPRRFGKSLFISMLENYYDINKADKFDMLFGDLYIGENPTPERNKYLVLKISFSSLETDQGKERLFKSFDDLVIERSKFFMRYYQDILGESELPVNIIGAEMAIRYLSLKALEVNKKIFVLIDEYDNFANDLMNQNKSMYYDVISGEGYIRTFYKTIKEGTMDSISKIFMTGVSPIMLDDLTSGFNITENLTLADDLNEMLGFTSDEIINIINELKISDFKDINEVYEDMKRYYNGYMFSKRAKNRIFNIEMSLFFLKYLTRNKEYPEEMIDNNVKTDYKRVNRIALNFEDEEAIEKIIQNEEVRSPIVSRFNLETMFNNKENFISLLYYLGMLTIKENLGYEVKLGIPNYVIKEIYWEQFRELIKKKISFDNNTVIESIYKMQKYGEIHEFIHCISDVLEKLSNRDLQNFDEKYIKCIFLTLLNMNKMYMLESEREVKSGYIDIFVTKAFQFRQFVDYEWIIELKYLKESQRSELEKVKTEGLKQLEKYGRSYQIEKGFEGDKVKKVLVVIVGKKDIYFEECE